MNEGEQKAYFEGLGFHEVRRLLDARRFDTTNERAAIKWLAEKDQEEVSRNEALQADMALAASRAADAAERAAAAAESQASEARRANTRATIALAIAIIGITVTVFSWLYPHH
jgi:hypothetical protein